MTSCNATAVMKKKDQSIEVLVFDSEPDVVEDGDSSMINEKHHICPIIYRELKFERS